MPQFHGPECQILNKVVIVIVIAGVATAFAARDLLGNMLSGIAIQFSRPFSVGDYITVSLSGLCEFPTRSSVLNVKLLQITLTSYNFVV